MSDDNRQPITEEMGVHKAWYDVRPKTPDELAEFVRGILAYRHDYGTICHAAAAAALAACWTVNADPTQGGITGFQAGAIMWEFIQRWQHLDGPARLLRLDDMIYPHHIDKFTSIPSSVFERLQKRAAEKLREHPDAHPENFSHWKRIVDGMVPFGYRIVD
jgi:hypothetical protein